jgi:AhpD family alkylhydroperoxidase
MATRNSRRLRLTEYGASANNVASSIRQHIISLDAERRIGVPPAGRIGNPGVAMARFCIEGEREMETRTDPTKVAPEVYRAMLALESAVRSSGLESNLLDLVRLRASQINGCAYCIDMHSKDLRAAGENEQRLYLLDAWREAPFYSDRERAALAWTEAVTLIAEGHVPDEVYDEARQYFTDSELARLTLAVVAINGWNRLGIAFRAPAGHYRPIQHHEAATV